MTAVEPTTPDESGTSGVPMACRVFGHRYSFRAEGPTLVWECERGCGERHTKTYQTAAEAKRYATAFDRRGNADLGRRAPLIGLFPLRLWRKIRDGSG